MLAHVFNPSTQEAKAGVSEFNASWVYRVSSRATQRNPPRPAPPPPKKKSLFVCLSHYVALAFYLWELLLGCFEGIEINWLNCK